MAATSTWVLKGAGNANLVFAYEGSDPTLAGMVLRIRKLPNWHVDAAAGAPKGQADEAAPTAEVVPATDPISLAVDNADKLALACMDRALWSDVLKDTGDGLSREEQYMLGYLTTWLDVKYIPRGVPCVLPASVNHALSPYFELLDTAHPPQLFMDHTVFAGGLPDGWVPAGPTLCAEVKPKAGCLAPTAYLAPDTADLKSRYPRFVMHSLYKAVKGKGELSYYNPQDLFSRDPPRVQRALRGLVAAPNNNLRLFVAGRQVWGDAAAVKAKGIHAAKGHGHAPPAPVDGEDSAAVNDRLASFAESLGSTRMAELGDMLQGVQFSPAAAPLAAPGGGGTGGVSQDGTSPVEVLVQALEAVLCEEELLPQVLALQEQDRVDVEGALPASQALSVVWQARLRAAAAACGPDTTPDAVTDTAITQAIGADQPDVWQGLPEREVAQLLRGYLTSATAKDCGIMVTLQQLWPVPGGAEEAAGEPAPATAATAAAQDREDLGPAAAKLATLCKANNGMVTVHTAPGDALHFRYKITALDLDLKSVTKIPSHAKLDASILAVARQHTHLLARMMGETLL